MNGTWRGLSLKFIAEITLRYHGGTGLLDTDLNGTDRFLEIQEYCLPCKYFLLLQIRNTSLAKGIFHRLPNLLELLVLNQNVERSY